MKLARHLKQNLPYLAITAIVVLILYHLSDSVGTDQILEVVKRAGFWGPLLFILLHSLTYIIAPLSGTPFFLAGFALFGKTFIFYTYFSTMIGVVANFWISRLWGRKIAVRLVGHENMDKVDSFTKDYGVKTLIFLRVTQGNFTDFISYAFGLTKMKFLPYFAISAVTPVFWVLFWWFILFPRIDNYQEFLFASALAVTPAVIVSVILFIRYLRKKS